MIWHEVALQGASSGEFEAQIAELGPFPGAELAGQCQPQIGHADL